MLKQALLFIKSNPLFPLQAVRNAARLELSIPLDFLRWGIDRRPRGRGPERIAIFGESSALRVELTIDLFGTKIDISSNISIEGIENSGEAFKLALRVRDLDIRAPAGSPAAQMVEAMDLSRPGDLIAMMPQKHADLIDAHDDRLVIDLLKLPVLARNRTLRRILGAVSFIGIREVRTDADVLVVGFSVHPTAIPSALLRARGA